MANVKLTDVCKTIFAGGDVPKDNYSLEQDEIYSIPIYTNGEQNNGLYGYTTKARVSEPSITVSARGTIGFTAIRTMPFYPAIRLITLTPNEKIDIRYLYYVTQNYKFDNGGTSIPQLTVPMLKSYSFPLPPLETQRQIAATLDKVNHTIDLCNAILEKLDLLVKARFVEMFGNPVTNEKEWNSASLESVCDGIGDGLHGTPEYDENGSYPFINGNNLINGIIEITSSTKMVNEATYKKHYIELSNNAILLSINGTLGKMAIYNNEKVMLGKSACYCNLKPFINREFVFGVMKTDAFMEFLERNSTASTIKNVGLKAIRSYKLILPPLDLQQQFAAFVKQTDKSKLAVKQVLEKAETLKKALMQEYFG